MTVDIELYEQILKISLELFICVTKLFKADDVQML